MSGSGSEGCCGVRTTADLAGINNICHLLNRMEPYHRTHGLSGGGLYLRISRRAYSKRTFTERYRAVFSPHLWKFACSASEVFSV